MATGPGVPPADKGRGTTESNRADEVREALESIVIQFAYWSEYVGGYMTGGLSALEDAFEVLGWDDPHPYPQQRCDESGCMRQVTCGWPTRSGGTGPNGGYRRTCGQHMAYKS